MNDFYYATLIEGNSYTLITRVFKVGERRVVDAKTKAYLEENATFKEKVTRKSNNESHISVRHVCRFEFVPVKSEDVDAAIAEDKRTEQAANTKAKKAPKQDLDAAKKEVAKKEVKPTDEKKAVRSR